MVLVNALPHTAAKKMYGNLKYDPVKSFTPIGSLGTVFVRAGRQPQFPATDLATFLTAVRAAPGKYNYGSSGIGTAPHLVFELFVRAAGLNVVHVPYQGSGPAMTGLLANDIQMALDNTATVPLIKAGKLRGLAQTGKTALAGAARSCRRSPRPDCRNSTRPGTGAC
jgi:tripartite-type tricarboxylate transporter receptor subunit TctC